MISLHTPCLAMSRRSLLQYLQKGKRSNEKENVEQILYKSALDASLKRHHVIPDSIHVCK